MKKILYALIIIASIGCEKYTNDIAISNNYTYKLLGKWELAIETYKQDTTYIYDSIDWYNYEFLPNDTLITTYGIHNSLIEPYNIKGDSIFLKYSSYHYIIIGDTLIMSMIDRKMYLKKQPTKIVNYSEI